MSDAVTAVAWLLRQDEPEARRLAAQQMIKVPAKQVCDLLLLALADEDWRVRKEATSVAAAIDARDEVVAALIAALDEKVNIGLRNAAVEALVAIGPAAVPATIDSLDTLDADGRKLAVEILGGIPDERGVAALARTLEDEDPNVRSAAAEALGSADRAGKEGRDIAIAALAALLSSDEVFLKLAALDALTRLDADLPWKSFEPFVRDPVLRRYAIAAAARSDDEDAFDALAAATTDPSRTIVREAVVAIGERLFTRVGDVAFKSGIERRLRAEPTAHDRIRPFARHSDDTRARPAAFVVLGIFGDTVDIPLFVEALADDDLMQHASLALQCFGAEAVGPLLALARGEEPQVRASVLSLVPTLHPGSLSAPASGPHGVGLGSDLHETILEALGDPSPEVVAAALRVLASNGVADDMGRIAVFATHHDPRVAAAAAAALTALATRFGAEARRSLDSSRAKHSEAAVACLVIGALARLGEIEEGDLAVLDLALAHGDARARRAALDALAIVGGESAGESVAFALADEERDVQLAAIRALGTLERTDVLRAVVTGERDAGLIAAALRALSLHDAEATFEVAHPLVKHVDPAIATAAVEAIGRLGAPRYRDVLFEALDHRDPEVVKSALSQIASHLDPRAITHLARCLDHEAWEVRRLACELLGSHARDVVQPLLHARLEREKDAIVRDALSAALSLRPAPMSER